MPQTKPQYDICLLSLEAVGMMPFVSWEQRRKLAVGLSQLPRYCAIDKPTTEDGKQLP